ncbi:hypothetical protein SCUP234_08089 [Seiridium cupressi]
MSHTPLRSPIKVSASQSQEDIKGYEVINQPLHEEEGGEEEQQETDGIRSDDMPPPGTQIKPSESQPRVHDQHMDVDDVPESVPQPAPVADQRTQQTRTPELTQRHIQRISAQRSPSSPGRLDPFDWEDFESRYQKALAEADQEEGDLLAEFEHLVKYFNIWASASSSHDNERAVKRLQTRTRYVHLSENKLKQKKEHLSEVVKAFQSALALLSTSR